MVSKNNQVINFSIEHNDSLGQGVSKQVQQITFIPKTLAGETGTALVHSSKKGVSFANLRKLDKKSPNRIEPECEHFNQCGGCHYLHTDYENEILIKKANLKRLLKNYISDLPIISSPNRLHYRNRIQLHYNKSLPSLGFYQALSNKITEVPNCLIGIPEISQELSKLYQNQYWLELVKNQPEQGVIEIYYLEGEAKIAINKGHAHLGFTQVNQQMNQHLKDWVKENFNSSLFALELFGGTGNLSQFIDQKNKLIIDQYPNPVTLPFINQDIYKPDALKKIFNHTPKQDIALIVDPPRSGLKNLKDWVNQFRAKELIYISCNPATFKRDIDSIKDQIKSTKIVGIDLFPGTYHMEIASHFILH